MKRFALIEGGVVANVVEQDDVPTIGGQWVEMTGQPVGPGDAYNGTNFSRAVREEWRLTHFAFMSRFAENEWVELDLMSVDDKTATPAVRRQAAKIRRALKQFEAAKFIDLKLPIARAGVLSMMQALQAAGVVVDAAGRSAQILDNPAADHEWP